VVVEVAGVVESVCAAGVCESLPEEIVFVPVPTPAPPAMPVLKIHGYVHGRAIFETPVTDVTHPANTDSVQPPVVNGTHQGNTESIQPPPESSVTHRYVLRETSLEEVIERFTEHAVRVAPVTFAMVLECISRCTASVDRANIAKYAEYNDAQSRDR